MPKTNGGWILDDRELDLEGGYDDDPAPTPMMDALYHIQGDVKRVRIELEGIIGGNAEARADLDNALDAITEAVDRALDAYARVRTRR
jgi:hypothetical protein